MGQCLLVSTLPHRNCISCGICLWDVECIHTESVPWFGSPAVLALASDCYGYFDGWGGGGGQKCVPHVSPTIHASHHEMCLCKATEILGLPVIFYIKQVQQSPQESEQPGFPSKRFVSYILPRKTFHAVNHKR